METVTMPRSVSVRFAHATVQALAEDHGVDLLHIKGPAVAHELLARGDDTAAPAGVQPEVLPRDSIDSDVLVRPSHVGRLVAAMHQHGWVTAYRFEDGSAFEHAATLVHPSLAPVDVHRWFPGLTGDPAAVFERLWADRTSKDIAGLPCPVPSVTAQRLLLIIHAARTGSLDHVDIQRSWTQAAPADREAVLRLVEEVGAQVALAAGTGRLAEYEGVRGYALWRALSTREPSLVRVWLARVRAEPTRRAAFRTAVRLIVPNPHRLEATLGRRPSVREMSRAYARRIRWGARETAQLVRSARRRTRGDR